MAQLFETSTKLLHPLRAHHTLGRSAQQVDTTLSGSTASRIHAALEWDGRQWHLRDLSRNGTWLGRSKTPLRHSVPITVGDEIRFGGPEAPRWQFVDDSAPTSLLIGLSPDTPTLTLSPYLFLPSDDAPKLVVTYSNSQRAWVQHSVEHSDGLEMTHSLGHGSVVNCDGKQWRVFLADSGDETVQVCNSGRSLDGIEFVFDLSLDEENTELRLQHQERTVDLGERSHHYLLLHLARQRAMEAGRGLDLKSQGWVDTAQLARDLGVDASHINILIFRARKQLAQSLASSVESEHLIERGKGRVRFGSSRFRIYKGEQLTFKLPLPEASHASSS